jgi:uroporphyrinogen decarboxylase
MVDGMNSMNSRERVLNALSHRAVDHVPVDFCGHNDTTIHRVAHKRLRTYLGLPPTKPTIANDVENVVYAEEDILVKFGVDTRAVYLPIPDQEGESQPDGSLLLTWPDGSVWRKPLGGLYYDLSQPALRGELTSQAIAAMPWPRIPLDTLEALGNRAEQLQSTTDYAVVMAGFLIMPVTGTQIWRGFDQWCIDTLENTRLWQEMTEAYLERAFSQADAILKAVGGFIDVAYFLGDDIATQNGPFISPIFYRKYIKPYHRQIVEFIRSRTDAKIVFHMCGAAREFIPDLIDVGIDAINPVQTTAKGMEPFWLKRDFGRDIAFWGGIDTQRTLPFGTTEDVKAEVRRIIDTLGPSGLVLASSHNMQADVPPENIAALFEAARESHISLW